MIPDRHGNTKPKKKKTDRRRPDDTKAAFLHGVEIALHMARREIHALEFFLQRERRMEADYRLEKDETLLECDDRTPKT